MNKYILALTLLFFSLASFAQESIDSISNKFDFEGDFRFRVEQDWNSIRSNGIYRENRFRFRERFRFGFTKKINPEFSVGMRIRTGILDEQQGPHITLGNSPGEHGIFPIGLEKAYLMYKIRNTFAWAGKNTYPFFRQNDLFWGDNVFPDGISFGSIISVEKLNIKPTFGYFLFKASNSNLNKSSRIYSIQTHFELTTNSRIKLDLNLGIVQFLNMADKSIDGTDLDLNYTIFLNSFRMTLISSKNPLNVGIDAYFNLENYRHIPHIDDKLYDEKTGIVFTAKYGATNQSGDWEVTISHALIGHFSLVPYVAQNDWGRWTYEGTNDSRLTNFNGVELKVAYALSKRINLVARYYNLRNKIKLGITKETGQRFRIDINAKF